MRRHGSAGKWNLDADIEMPGKAAAREPAILNLAWDRIFLDRRLRDSRGPRLPQGGVGGALTKAMVCRNSSHDGKIRKVVAAAIMLKNWRREPGFWRARRQRSSMTSQRVCAAKASRFSATRTAERFFLPWPKL
jgi:hypothetical protein